MIRKLRSYWLAKRFGAVGVVPEVVPAERPPVPGIEHLGLSSFQRGDLRTPCFNFSNVCGFNVWGFLNALKRVFDTAEHPTHACGTKFCRIRVDFQHTVCEFCTDFRAEGHTWRQAMHFNIGNVVSKGALRCINVVSKGALRCINGVSKGALRCINGNTIIVKLITRVKGGVQGCRTHRLYGHRHRHSLRPYGWYAYTYRTTIRIGRGHAAWTTPATGKAGQVLRSAACTGVRMFEFPTTLAIVFWMGECNWSLEGKPRDKTAQAGYNIKVK